MALITFCDGNHRFDFKATFLPLVSVFICRRKTSFKKQVLFICVVNGAVSVLFFTSTSKYWRDNCQICRYFIATVATAACVEYSVYSVDNYIKINVTAFQGAEKAGSFYLC